MTSNCRNFVVVLSEDSSSVIQAVYDDLQTTLRLVSHHRFTTDSSRKAISYFWFTCSSEDMVTNWEKVF